MATQTGFGKQTSVKIYSLKERPLPIFPSPPTRTDVVLKQVMENAMKLREQQYMLVDNCSPYTCFKIGKWCRTKGLNYKYIRATKMMYIVNGTI